MTEPVADSSFATVAGVPQSRLTTWGMKGVTASTRASSGNITPAAPSKAPRAALMPATPRGDRKSVSRSANAAPAEWPMMACGATPSRWQSWARSSAMGSIP